MLTVLYSETREHNGKPLPHPPGTHPYGYEGAKDDDVIEFNVPQDQIFACAELEILDGKYNCGVRIKEQPTPGTSGSNMTIKVHWFFDGGPKQAFIKYKISIKTASQWVPDKKVPGFWPSTHGFHFWNYFPSLNIVIPVTLPMGQVVNVPLQNTFHGACGGMAFAVRDYFDTGFLLPPDTAPPASGIIHDYIVKRLKDSFNLPNGPSNYMKLMDPNLSDSDILSPTGNVLLRGRKTILREAWNAIRDDIDHRHLSPMGIVLLQSTNPLKLGENHQILAYGYTDYGNNCGSIFVYDPNFPGNNMITITFRSDDNSSVIVNSPYPACYGFFRNNYSPDNPPEPSRQICAKIALKSWNGKYVVAEGGGGGVVNANRDSIGPWETLRIEKPGSAELSHDDLVYIKAANNQYLVAENGGGDVLKANRDKPLNWERFIIQRTYGPHISMQDKWCQCKKCQGLVYTGNPSAGACPAGGTHDPDKNTYFKLFHNSTVPGQTQWRWCNKCQGLTYTGNPSLGTCPAGSQHDHTGSGNYTVSLNTAISGQNNWRLCNKCQSLQYRGGSTTPGPCPTGGQHDSTGSYNYALSLGLSGSIGTNNLVIIRCCNDQYVVAEGGGNDILPDASIGVSQ